jgi:hypothetical protein
MSEIGGFRDLVSELDCLKFEARCGRLSNERFCEEMQNLLNKAKRSLDPKVDRILVPVLLASAQLEEQGRGDSRAPDPECL